MYVLSRRMCGTRERQSPHWRLRHCCHPESGSAVRDLQCPFSAKFRTHAPMFVHAGQYICGLSPHRTFTVATQYARHRKKGRVSEAHPVPPTKCKFQWQIKIKFQFQFNVPYPLRAAKDRPPPAAQFAQPEKQWLNVARKLRLVAVSSREAAGNNEIVIEGWAIRPRFDFDREGRAQSICFAPRLGRSGRP
jgi:hypothetical protein